MTEDPSEEPDGASGQQGHLRPTSGAALTAFAVAGLLGGWLLHPVAYAVAGSAPVVTWVQVGVPFFVAGLLAVTARATWRAVQQRHGGLDAHRAVNRLVLGRACALVGALVAGGYTGYAVSWLGLSAELAPQRIWRSAAAAVGGLAILGAATVLERACRVRSDDDEA